MSPKYCSLAVDDHQIVDSTLDNEFAPDLKVVVNQRYATLSDSSNSLNEIITVSGKITVSF